MASTGAGSRRDPIWDDPTLIWIMIGILLVGVAVTAWMFAGREILIGFAYLLWPVFWCMLGLHDLADAVGLTEGLYWLISRDDLFVAQRWLKAVSLDFRTLHSVRASDLAGMLSASGAALRWIVLLWALWSIYRIARVTAPSRLMGMLSLFDVAKLNAQRFPQTRPALIENLHGVPPDVGPYRRELGPLGFGIVNHALYVIDDPIIRTQSEGKRRTVTFDNEHEDDEHYLVVKDVIDDTLENRSHGLVSLRGRIHVDRERLAELFAGQVGRRWRGHHELRWHEKILFTAFAAQANRNKTKSAKILATANANWVKRISNGRAEYQTDVPRIEAMTAKMAKTSVVCETVNRHAYVSTVLMRLLNEARLVRGRLPPSDFLWLKAIDRPLWYALNGLGGETAWTESAGAYCHYLAEKTAEVPLVLPYLDQAMIGYERYLREMEGWLSADHEGSVTESAA